MRDDVILQCCLPLAEPMHTQNDPWTLCIYHGMYCKSYDNWRATKLLHWNSRIFYSPMLLNPTSGIPHGKLPAHCWGIYMKVWRRYSWPNVSWKIFRHHVVVNQCLTNWSSNKFNCLWEHFQRHLYGRFLAAKYLYSKFVGWRVS